MSKPRKNASIKRKRKQNGLSNNQNQGSRTQEMGDSRRMPAMSGLSDQKPIYNPTWNPQWFKVARTFQYSAPSGDVGGGYAVVVDPSVTPSATVHTYGMAAYAFAISHIPSVTEYGTLFDQYRIAGVQMRLEYLNSSESVLGTAATALQQCTLLLFEDNDDGTSPASTNAGFAAALETGRCVRKVFPNKTNTLTYMMRPKYLTSDVDTSAGVTGRSLGSGWVDGSTGLDVQWRGLKLCIQANPSPVTYTHIFRMTATYFTEWRNRQ
jgi:hypothetical protein